jgi:hypothetical protein
MNDAAYAATARNNYPQRVPKRPARPAVNPADAARPPLTVSTTSDYGE